MKLINVKNIVIIGLLCLPSWAYSKELTYEQIDKQITKKNSISRNLGVDEKTLHHSIDVAHTFALQKYEVQPLKISDPIAAFESPAPNKTAREISDREKSILGNYLDNPKNIELAEYLAFFHLEQSLLAKKLDDKGDAVKHSIIALYFLNRLNDLGNRSPWIDKSIHKLTQALTATLIKPKGKKISLQEGHEAHKYFLDTFNYHEENRYIAAKKVLDDYLADNSDVYTAHLVDAVFLWNASESQYGDPGILYDMLVGSYFSSIAIAYAKEAELAWKDDPQHNQRYRMASLLGGLTTLFRNWLAVLHSDRPAVEAIYREHADWVNVHRIFISFPYVLTTYQESTLFDSALEAIQMGHHDCITAQPPRTCWNEARFSFNVETFSLTRVDMLLKAGRVDEARGVLNFIKTFPTFQFWDLGKQAYQFRLDNLDAIVKHYQNNDPNDDLLLFALKRQKWGIPTMVCQGCHQAQSKTWTAEDKEKISLPPEKYATVGNWPNISTEWYGAIKK